MKKILIPLLILVFAFLGASSAFAQDAPYYFEVPQQDVHVYWNADGTMSLDYVWVFNNQPGAHPIDFVDVGMPNSNFDMSSISADVDGIPVSVSRGEYQGNGSGFAVVMGSQTIPAGGSATVHVYVGRITEVLHPDDNDEAYASAVFAPQYFGSQYVKGTTDLMVTFHLPPDMAESEPRWHTSPSGFPSEPSSVYDAENRITYTWNSTSARASSYYEFGASFPRSYVPADSVVVPPAISSDFNEDLFPVLAFGCFFFFSFIVAPALTAFQNSRRKMKYLPPKVAIEGHGIKRGLTAVESAILMEQPLDKVMTMTLFGVIKKGAAAVKSRNPLELQINEPLPENLHEYEKDFLASFKLTDKKKRQDALQNTMISLVKSVSEKIRGFSRRETVDYYKAIMEKAWQMVEAENTPEVKSQKFDEALEWTMLDKDYDDRTRRTFQQPIFLPRWWGNYDPTYRPAAPTSTGGGGMASPVSTPSGQKGLPGADFAASMVTGVQTFSQNVVGNINTFTEKITGKTNPPPKPSSGSRGGGGGRSCACACACAGCACACAGGGR